MPLILCTVLKKLELCMDFNGLSRQSPLSTAPQTKIAPDYLTTSHAMCSALRIIGASTTVRNKILEKTVVASKVSEKETIKKRKQREKKNVFTCTAEPKLQFQ